MIRVAASCALALLLVTSCGRKADSGNGGADTISVTGTRIPQSNLVTTSPVTTIGADKAGPKLAYSHHLALEMAADRVGARFERARTACLSEPAPGCALVHATLNAGDTNSGAPPSATLTVRLSHDKVKPFEAALLAPVGDETKGDPIIRESTTDAEDLTDAIQDADRRMAQLQDYRARLETLAKRGDAKTADLIQVEEKISEVQSDIEQLQAQQRGLNQRVDTEVLSIDLSAKATLAAARSPLAEAWRNAGRVLGNSAASAFLWTVVLIPWIPLIAIGLWLLSLLWRMIRVRRHKHRHGHDAAEADAAH